MRKLHGIGSGDHHGFNSTWLPLPEDARLREEAAEQRMRWDEIRQEHRAALQSGVRDRVNCAVENKAEV